MLQPHPFSARRCRPGRRPCRPRRPPLTHLCACCCWSLFEERRRRRCCRAPRPMPRLARLEAPAPAWSGLGRRASPPSTSRRTPRERTRSCSRSRCRPSCCWSSPRLASMEARGFASGRGRAPPPLSAAEPPSPFPSTSPASSASPTFAGLATFALIALFLGQTTDGIAVFLASASTSCCFAMNALRPRSLSLDRASRSAWSGRGQRGGVAEAGVLLLEATARRAGVVGRLGAGDCSRLKSVGKCWRETRGHLCTTRR